MCIKETRTQYKKWNKLFCCAFKHYWRSFPRGSIKHKSKSERMYSTAWWVFPTLNITLSVARFQCSCLTNRTFF